MLGRDPVQPRQQALADWRQLNRDATAIIREMCPVQQGRGGQGVECAGEGRLCDAQPGRDGDHRLTPIGRQRTQYAPLIDGGRLGVEGDRQFAGQHPLNRRQQVHHGSNRDGRHLGSRGHDASIVTGCILVGVSPLDVVRPSLEVLVDGPSDDVLRLGLLIPMSGPLGLTATSALDAACLAATEVNERGGERGRRVELVLVDAGSDPDRVAAESKYLADAKLVDAFVGLHTSDVHRAIESALAGRTPYIFTPPHEGGRRSPGVVLIGDPPARQIGPALTNLMSRRGLRRWVLIGSDYIWTWSMHRFAAKQIVAAGGSVVSSRLVPFGLRSTDADELVDLLCRRHADAVLLSLIGSDLAVFNRAFARAGLGDRVVRLSGSLEENGLLAAGGDDTGELYSAMRSFAGQADDRRRALAENHHRAFGDFAPVLDAYSEGCYDGVHLAVALAAIDALAAAPAQSAARHLLARNGVDCPDAWSHAPVGAPQQHRCLARAEGLDFEVVAAL
ncbi:MAG: urea transport system substrate-binding protein [Mycobacterium sp.]|nr:urea transport system substrate-binding protein [Mycobacterium sp.]